MRESTVGMCVCVCVGVQLVCVSTVDVCVCHGAGGRGASVQNLGYVELHPCGPRACSRIFQLWTPPSPQKNHREQTGMFPLTGEFQARA